jgi:3-hydroxyacyl-[acyl-carrier-protein] dehydratase
LALDSDAIQRLLPHRWPMLLVDRAYDVVPGVSGYGVKAVSSAEPCFAGHFPGHSVFPGVLVVEALAQLAGIVLASQALVASDGSLPPAGPPIGYLGSLRQIKFTRLVVPGDVLTLRTEAGRSINGLVSMSVLASVGKETAVSGSLAVTLPQNSGGSA